MIIIIVIIESLASIRQVMTVRTRTFVKLTTEASLLVKVPRKFPQENSSIFPVVRQRRRVCLRNVSVSANVFGAFAVCFCRGSSVHSRSALLFYRATAALPHETLRDRPLPTKSPLSIYNSFGGNHPNRRINAVLSSVFMISVRVYTIRMRNKDGLRSARLPAPIRSV